METEVNKRLPGKTPEVVEFVTKAQLKEHHETKARQQSKFQRLIGKEKTTQARNEASECISRWVKNCSDRILSDPELCVLKKGLNFAVTPRKVPVVDIVTATESACRSLNNGDANELRSKVVNILNKNEKVKEQNVGKDEWDAIDNLRKDDSIIVLPADKGRVTVVMNKKDYLKKCEDLLSDEKTYSKLRSDPTAKYKKELVSALKELKDRKVINDPLHKRLYPTCDQPPRFYGLPKVHKPSMPLRPIVSSIGTITYQCARYLADVLSPLVGKTKHHVKNSKEFSREVKQLSVGPDEELRSYDVSALFTSVPVDKALVVIGKKLEEDTTLSERTPLSPSDIITLLGLCLKCTYFLFQGKYYLQIHGAAMGSPVSPIVCNLYMEDFEKRALESAEHPPVWWKRYVDDTHTKLKKAYSEAFTEHLNSVDEDIKWTTEAETTLPVKGEDDGDIGSRTERALAFLDTLTVINDDGSVRTKVFRKETHTDQYLNFQSNHPLEHKRGVVRTLVNRAESIVSKEEELKEEKHHIREALRLNGYPDWIIDDKPSTDQSPTPSEQSEAPMAQQRGAESGVNSRPSRRYPVVIPYIRGLSEELRRTFKKYDVRMYFKPTNTLRQLLVRPKDKLPKERVVGPVYHIQCEDCPASYVGETERSLKARFQEHRRPSTTTSEVSKHINQDHPEHSVDMTSAKILEVEPKWFERGVKEAIHIRTSQPSLNRDGGRYNLPGVWTNLLRRRIPGPSPGGVAAEQSCHLTTMPSGGSEVTKATV